MLMTVLMLIFMVMIGGRMPLVGAAGVVAACDWFGTTRQQSEEKKRQEQPPSLH